jgi:hypothetical protein
MTELVVRVLLIGNSLTAANDLPATVTAMGRAAGVRIVCTTVAKPNFSLEDHWNDGEARRAIARGGWSFVVLQQGPSALPESRVLLEEYVRRFDGLIRRAGAQTAVFMVWPSRDRSGDFAGVSASYAAAAASVGARLARAGDAWRDAWRRDPRLALYGPDGFHPTPLGSLLAAMVIEETITGRPVPADGLTSVDPSVRATLIAAAGSVRLRGPRSAASLRTPGAAAGRATAGFR